MQKVWEPGSNVRFELARRQAMNTKVDLKRGMPAQSLRCLEALRKRGHSQCMAYLHPEFKLDFKLEDERVLTSQVTFTEKMTSFNRMVHGGLQSFLIDQAMTCALMGVGVFAATCELNLRYRSSVEVGMPVTIRVWVERRYRTIYEVEAELLQADKICTHAHAKFFEQDLKSEGDA